MNEHTRIAEAIAAHALGDADAAQTEELLQHLVGCTPCRELYRDLHATAADLALAGTPVAMPEELTARILAAAAGPGAPARDAAPQRRRRAPRILAAAALLTLAAVGSTSVRLAMDLDDQRDRARTMARAAAWLADPTVTTTSLEGDGPGDLALSVRRDGRALLVGSGLPARGLELWALSADGTPRPLTWFLPREGTAVVDLRFDPRGTSTLAVTFEDRRVSAPTGAPVYRAAIARG